MDYSKNLGANYPIGTKQIVLFVPEKDKEGKPINQAFWVEEALKCFGLLFRGATSFPQGKGIWRNDNKGKELLIEKTVIVISYTSPKDLNEKNFKKIRTFLHRMGKEANQGEIGIVIDGSYYAITDYDS